MGLRLGRCEWLGEVDRVQDQSLESPEALSLIYQPLVGRGLQVQAQLWAATACLPVDSLNYLGFSQHNS